MNLLRIGRPAQTDECPECAFGLPCERPECLAVQRERERWEACFWRDTDGRWAVNLDKAIPLLDREENK